MSQEKQKNPHAQALGARGGRAILKKIGKKGMRELGERGAKARWKNKENG